MSIQSLWIFNYYLIPYLFPGSILAAQLLLAVPVSVSRAGFGLSRAGLGLSRAGFGAQPCRFEIKTGTADGTPDFLRA